MTALTVVSAAGSPPSPPSRATGSGERSAHAPAGALKGFGFSNHHYFTGPLRVGDRNQQHAISLSTERRERTPKGRPK